MSAIMYALERLDHAVGRLDFSVENVETALAAEDLRQPEQPQLRDAHGNVVDVDFVSKRIDRAIKAVEYLLNDEPEEKNGHVGSYAANQ